MSKLERVAAAICCPNGCANAGYRRNDVAGRVAICQAHTFDAEARAVLRELREPGDEVISASGNAFLVECHKTTHCHEDAITIWQAGIDAILGGE